MTNDATQRVGPLVSIVTATRNRAELLEWTIHSVRAQTYPNIEHIVVDGASTDGTVDLLKRYEGSYPMRWSSEPDAGMYFAINRGLREAKGEILAYLNSDDLYFPWTVEVVVNTFHHDTAADFVFGDALAFEESTGRATPYWMPPFDLDYIQRSGFMAQPTVFWRRRVSDSVGAFDESLRYVADCDYWMRTGALFRYVKTNEFLAIERNHEGTLRVASGDRVWEELRAVRSRYVNLDGSEHEHLVREHDSRRRRWERVFILGLLAQAFVPKQIRRGPWSKLLNSGVVDVERLRYVIRASKVGRHVPGLDRLADGDLFRADPSLLTP